MEFNESDDVDDGFKGSPTWVPSALRRSDIVGVNVHGKAGDKTDEEYQEIVNKWKPEFWKSIREKGTYPSRIYNGS